MTTTTVPSDGADADLTNVSSTSARIVYYELADRGEASVADLSEATGYEESRIADLLETLAENDLVDETDGSVVA